MYLQSVVEIGGSGELVDASEREEETMSMGEKLVSKWDVFAHIL